MSWAVGDFCGYGGPVWVMDEWAVGQWIVGVTSFQKIYGLYGLKHHYCPVQLIQNFLAHGLTNGRTNEGNPSADLKRIAKFYGNIYNCKIF